MLRGHGVCSRHTAVRVPAERRRLLAHIALIQTHKIVIGIQNSISFKRWKIITKLVKSNRSSNRKEYLNQVFPEVLEITVQVALQTSSVQDSKPFLKYQTTRTEVMNCRYHNNTVIRARYPICLSGIVDPRLDIQSALVGRCDSE